MTAPFDWTESLPKYAQELWVRLAEAGVPESFLDDVVQFRQLIEILLSNDDDVETFVNEGINAAAIGVSVAAATIGTGSATAVSFSGTDFVQGSAASWASGSATRVTIDQGGLWRVHGHALWSATATGVRDLAVRVGGSTVIAGSTAPATTAVAPKNQAGRLLELTAGDYLEAVLFQDSGSNKSVNVFLTAEYAGNLV